MYLKTSQMIFEIIVVSLLISILFVQIVELSLMMPDKEPELSEEMRRKIYS